MARTVYDNDAGKYISYLGYCTNADSFPCDGINKPQDISINNQMLKTSDVYKCGINVNVDLSRASVGSVTTDISQTISNSNRLAKQNSIIYKRISGDEFYPTMTNNTKNILTFEFITDAFSDVNPGPCWGVTDTTVPESCPLYMGYYKEFFYDYVVSTTSGTITRGPMPVCSKVILTFSVIHDAYNFISTLMAQTHDNGIITKDFLNSLNASNGLHASLEITDDGSSGGSGSGSGSDSPDMGNGTYIKLTIEIDSTYKAYMSSGFPNEDDAIKTPYAMLFPISPHANNLPSHGFNINGKYFERCGPWMAIMIGLIYDLNNSIFPDLSPRSGVVPQTTTINNVTKRYGYFRFGAHDSVNNNVSSEYYTDLLLTNVEITLTNNSTKNVSIDWPVMNTGGSYIFVAYKNNANYTYLPTLYVNGTNIVIGNQTRIELPENTNVTTTSVNLYDSDLNYGDPYNYSGPQLTPFVAGYTYV